MFCGKKEKDNYFLKSKSLPKRDKLHIELSCDENVRIPNKKF